MPLLRTIGRELGPLMGCLAPVAGSTLIVLATTSGLAGAIFACIAFLASLAGTMMIIEKRDHGPPPCRCGSRRCRVGRNAEAYDTEGRYYDEYRASCGRAYRLTYDEFRESVRGNDGESLIPYMVRTSGRWAPADAVASGEHDASAQR